MSPFWLGFNSTIILIGGWKFVKDKFAEESFAYDSGIHGVSCALCGNWEEDQTLPDSSGMRYCEGCETVLCIDCDPRKMRIVIEPNGDATHYCDACELEDYWAEDHGENVRNELAGSDIMPEFTGRNDPFKDWAMMQKGYQGMRMMNDSDDFDAETKKVRRHRLDRFTKPVKSRRSFYESRGRRFAIKDLFGSEWHTFAPCETEGCDGDIEYRDVYYCSDCGQDDVEILIGDTCPDCGVVATDTATYAIFYCSDCGEDFSDEYNAEVQTTTNKVRTISGKPLQLRKLKKDRDLKPEDAIERLEISAESNQDIKWGDVKEMHNSKCPFCFRSAFRLIDEEGEAFSVYEEDIAGDNWLLECSRCKAEWNQSGENTLDGGYTGNAEADEFNAQVYRGKPFTELGYAERAVLQHKMLEAAEIEQAIINLEAAVRMGLISEDEVMKSLVERFGA